MINSHIIYHFTELIPSHNLLSYDIGLGAKLLSPCGKEVKSKIGNEYLLLSHGKNHQFLADVIKYDTNIDYGLRTTSLIQQFRPHEIQIGQL